MLPGKKCLKKKTKHPKKLANLFTHFMLLHLRFTAVWVNVQRTGLGIILRPVSTVSATNQIHDFECITSLLCASLSSVSCIYTTGSL